VGHRQTDTHTHTQTHTQTETHTDRHTHTQAGDLISPLSFFESRLEIKYFILKSPNIIKGILCESHQ
jgi:hypothetical protein